MSFKTLAWMVLLFTLASPERGSAAPTTSDVRALLRERVGDLDRLRVPAQDEDLPQPLLEDGTLDPRFAITSERARLGKLLFFDPVRSTDIRPELGGAPSTARTASCGTCHLGEAASKAGQVTAIGVGGSGRHETGPHGERQARRDITEGMVDDLPTGMEILDADGDVVASGRFDGIDSPARSAPSCIGFAFNRRLLWGGEAGGPNPAGYPAGEDVVRAASGNHRMASEDSSHLSSIPVYVELFARAFPAEAELAEAANDVGLLVNVDTQFRAIAAFLRTVITRNTPWDRFLAGEDALTPGELRGAWLFAAPASDGGANCIACHSGPALNKRLGDETGELIEENFHNVGTAEHPLFELARTAFAAPDLHDLGRSGVTGAPASAYAFKTPTLRQVRDAAPYFHGGSAATLRAAIEHFDRGLPMPGVAAEAESLSPLFTHPREPDLRGLDLSEDDIDALVEFLGNALYDPGFVHDMQDSPTRCFELTVDELRWEDELKALGAVDGWLPSSLPNGFNDDLSRGQLLFVRGEANSDGRLDLSDGVYVLSYLFAGASEPSPMETGDANDDSRVDIADPIYIFSFLFGEGPAPPQPYPLVGQDLTF